MKYWLVKTEEDVYPIAKLEKDHHTLWDGVRNYQARNYLREMAPGDLVYIYHSNAVVTGIVGIAMVEEAAVPDPLQFNKKSDYYDEKATPDEPRWFSPRLRHVETFPRTIPLTELKDLSDLSECPLVRKGNRLSVLPLQAREYKAIAKLK